MKVPATSASQVRVGPFTIDLVARELRKAGNKVPLQDKPFHILALLLENAGELVTRDTIRQKLWPVAFVDFEHNINTAIKTLRKALDDDSSRPRYIETLPQRGYRFIAPVKECGSKRGRLLLVPFQNLDASGGQRFSRALAEQMITGIGKACTQIDVVVPSDLDGGNLGALPNQLAVDYLLAGSILRSDGHIRINARLLRATDQCCVWSETFTHKRDEMLSLHDDVTTEIARAIGRLLVGATSSS